MMKIRITDTEGTTVEAMAIQTVTMAAPIAEDHTAAHQTVVADTDQGVRVRMAVAVRTETLKEEMIGKKMDFPR